MGGEKNNERSPVTIHQSCQGCIRCTEQRKKNCQRAHISGRSNKRDFWHSTSGKGTSKSFRKRYKNPGILCESSLSKEWEKLLETCPDLSVEREQAMASKRRLLDRLQAQ